jgi:single-strand DNA-binding protein
MSLYASGVVRIISEPQIKFFDSGTCVCNFGGGISEGKDKDGNYINNAIDVEVWGKGGEMIADNCKKGDSIMVTGAIRRQDWTDKESGAKRSKHVLNVQRFEYLPRAKAAESEAAF